MSRITGDVRIYLTGSPCVRPVEEIRSSLGANSRGTLRARRRVFTYCSDPGAHRSERERHADTIDVLPAGLLTLRDAATTNRYVRRSLEKVSHSAEAQSSQGTWRRYVRKKRARHRGHASTRKRTRREPKKERDVSATRAYVGRRVRRGSGASVPKGSGGCLDGGTVVVVVAEQRGVTWGYTTWGPGPSGPGWRRRKCAAYIRPGTDGNQHPVHSWTHPEHRESKNENPGTSSVRAA